MTILFQFGLLLHAAQPGDLRIRNFPSLHSSLWIPRLSFLAVSGSEIHQPALDLFESDARVSASQRMGFDPGGRAIHKLFGSEGRNHDQAKV